MRVVAVSIWIFLNLTVFGLVSYCYILWVEYWKVAKRADDALHVKLVSNLMKRPNIPDETKINRLELYDDNQVLPLEVENDYDTEDDVTKFKRNLISDLRRSQREFKMKFFDKIALDENTVGEVYNEKTMEELYCKAKNTVNVKSVVEDVLNHHSALNKVLPKSSFAQDYYKFRYHSCAVVSSAGSMASSQLGTDIDAHDAILRFNNAPTDGYEQDVGSKTTFRLLNSKVLANDSVDLLNSQIYKNVTLIGWDPGIKGQTLDQWFEEPNFDLFGAYEKFRRAKSSQPFYLLHPEFVWSAWKFIQESSNFRIPLNPPSSGFLGMMLMMEICQWVNVYEYLPSMRMTEKCHYYDKEKNIGCTFGNWHPLAAEKLLTINMNTANEKETFINGKVTMRGFHNHLHCP